VAKAKRPVLVRLSFGRMASSRIDTLRVRSVAHRSSMLGRRSSGLSRGVAASQTQRQCCFACFSDSWGRGRPDAADPSRPSGQWRFVSWASRLGMQTQFKRSFPALSRFPQGDGGPLPCGGFARPWPRKLNGGRDLAGFLVPPALGV